MAGLMEGRRVMVFGVANERSIAWGISRVFHEQGARLGFNYVGEALEKRVRPLAESVDADLILPCDVTEDAQVSEAFSAVRETWGGLDVLIHSVAFADRADLDGRFSDTSRAGFLQAMEISAYSMVHLAREAAPLMAEGGTMLTMTYYGAEKVVQNYNVMGVAKAALEASVRYLAADLGTQGIRVNAISAGPIKTLAASGVRGFRNILAMVEERAPLHRNVTQEDVGRNALYLCSDLSAGVTGQVVHVDSGFSILGF
ncbi:MAG TPA: enoyl-ACP reductase FabI [Longimicrobiales bacterium]|nr:enoyl-ACP reductase FabI [Longimicrobiales bacterium]